MARVIIPALEAPAMIDNRDLERISEIIGAPPSITWSGKEFSALRGPLVYAWFRGGRAHYIGLSTRGAQRPLDCQHERIGQDLVQEMDAFYLWLLPSADLAIEAEDNAISELRPLLNRRRRIIPILRSPDDRTPMPSRDDWRPLEAGAVNVERAAQTLRSSLLVRSILKFNPRVLELLGDLKQHVAELEAELARRIGPR